MIGEKLGPYEILSSIGSGGMGDVWKARDTRLDRVVAIKKVKEQHSERFKREARSIAALNHPNICQIHDIGDDYLVLEYIKGKPLSSPLPEQEALQLAIQVATALEEAHQYGIIHRDLKPSNIMVTDKGSVKLLDFGLAKLYEYDQSISNLPTEDFPATQAGVILGTVAYMSPEQAQGQPVDARSDIFSFGLVLYEMLSGRRAFSGDNKYAVMDAILKKEPEPLQASPALEKIVKRCLEKSLSKRYQAMSEVKAAMERTVKPKVTVSSEEPQPSIAVLPFVNMSGDKEQEYFSDGLAEEIINALTKIPELKVVARTSAFAFKGKEQDIRKIGETLNVSTILEGSVRKAADRIRITAQLIKAADGYHLWSERYDREMTDVFAVQDEIASAIVNTLQLKLSTKLATQQNPQINQAAYEAYLKARYYWGKNDSESLERCKTFIEEAIALDPNFAQAHCGYADYLLLLSARSKPTKEIAPIVREEALKALDIDPTNREAYAILGIVSCILDFNWQEAERCFHLAMAVNSVPPRIHIWYGWFYLLSVGRIKDAIEQQDKGLKADPLNNVARSYLAYSYLFEGRLEDAEREVRKILKFDTDFGTAEAVLALIYIQQERWTDALSLAERASATVPYSIGIVAGILKRIGQTNRAADLIHKLKPYETCGAILGHFYYHFISSENEEAIKWMEKAIEHRDSTFQVAPMLYRFTSRWPQIAKLMNLPDEVL